MQFKSFLDEQRSFWTFVTKCTELLGYKLGAYVRELPEYWKLDSPTRELADQIDTLRHDVYGLVEYINTDLRWYPPKRVTVPVHVANRLLEEVKHPPPFIPPLARRFSFG